MDRPIQMGDSCLRQPVTVLKGVGEVSANDLSLLGITTVEDLLLHFPYRYDDFRLKDLAKATHQEQVTVEGTVHTEPTTRFYDPNKSRTVFKVWVKPHLITAVVFNRPYIKKQLRVGQSILLRGKWDKQRRQLTVQQYTLAKSENFPNSLLPVYATAGQIKVAQLRRWIKTALDQYGQYIPEILPSYLIKRYRLLSRSDALRQIHFPRSWQEGEQAKRRLVYEELLLFQLKLQVLKERRRHQTEGIRQAYDPQRVKRFLSSLPFSLTPSQRKALDEILTDMSAPYTMHRLLQGDVGSGKTVVAAAALLASVSAGYQAALMVPTEILAEQHYLTLQHLFAQESVQLALLTSSVGAQDRKAVLAGLQLGTIDIIVGTHALIQEAVQFRNLGLIITDEQHRFGVKERRRLRQKGRIPDTLLMTATPIPRTLAMTAFGDMDVTTIDQLPAGRKPVKTYWVKTEMLRRVFQFLKREVEKGRQAYVVCPLIEESEKLDVQNVLDFYEKLTRLFPQFKVGLLHGKLPTAKKEYVMKCFAKGEIQVLVATTIIEVGVDVPNASLMVIYNAERFGLAQLHQLRGRVGRGNAQSYCILIADPKTEAGIKRMEIMRSTTDGFEVAQKDLALRGPGDFFGTKQSGLPEFKLADLVHDGRVLQVAATDAVQLWRNLAFRRGEIYAPLRSVLTAELEKEKEWLD